MTVKKPKIYLDVCAIQHPLDSPTHIRINVEAEVILGIIALCESGEVELVSSDAVLYEVARNPHPIRREHAYAVLGKAKQVIRLDTSVQERAALLCQEGLAPVDALHLALAQAGKVDYFCSCGDTLIRRAKQITDLQFKPVLPIELIQEIRG